MHNHTPKPPGDLQVPDPNAPGYVGTYDPPPPYEAAKGRTDSPMSERNDGLNGVPMTEDGLPLLVASTEQEFWLYVHWLADYLYRPETYPGPELDRRSAIHEVIGIESDITSRVWNDPYADYPPRHLCPGGARHSDILHREPLARVLSRVHSREDRRKVLEWFFVELNRDLAK